MTACRFSFRPFGAGGEPEGESLVDIAAGHDRVFGTRPAKRPRELRCLPLRLRSDTPPASSAVRG